MSPQEMKRLQAAELHEQSSTGIEIVSKRYERYIELSCEGLEVLVFLKSSDHDKYPMALVGDDTGLKTAWDFDVMIALLQRAQQIIDEEA